MDGGPGFWGCYRHKGFLEMHRFGPTFKRGLSVDILVKIYYKGGAQMERMNNKKYAEDSGFREARTYFPGELSSAFFIGRMSNGEKRRASFRRNKKKIK